MKRIFVIISIFCLLTLGLLPFSTDGAIVSEQLFESPPASPQNGNHALGGGWFALCHDLNDDKMILGSAMEGGLRIQRGTPWGIPGGFVTAGNIQSGPTATIESVMEIGDTGGGDHSGRVTLLAGWTEAPRETPMLALQYDTAGTNGASSESGGPGELGGRSIRGGLKLTGSLLNGELCTGKEGEKHQPYILLAPEEPSMGHIYESGLSFHGKTGKVSVKVYDKTADQPVYEGTFLPCKTMESWIALSMVGGYNAYANWANDKGFALRFEAVRLLDTYEPRGRDLDVPMEGAWEGPIPRRNPFPELNQFLGACNLPGPTWHAYGLGWARHDFSWDQIEPEQNIWTWRKYDKIVTDAHRNGFEILPILCYTAQWAASTGGDGLSPPAHVKDWEDYVEHTVARYSRPPFNLRYFQVWNEPTWEPMTFWHGTGPQWVESIFLPAAKIIRRYDCDVVFGGWPVADSSNLFKALNYKDAWQWTDIIDVHYFEMEIWQQLYDRYIATGKCKGIWQTEIGYHPYPGYIPNCYLRALHWSLRQEWSFPDQYKLFWYAFWGAGSDEESCLTGQDNHPTHHGKRLLTMNQILGGTHLSILEDYSTKPSLKPLLEEEKSTILGFQAGEQRIIVLLLDEDTLEKHSKIDITIHNIPEHPRSVLLFDEVGRSRSLIFEHGDQRLRTSVATSGLPTSLARNWGKKYEVATAYVVIH